MKTGGNLEGDRLSSSSVSIVYLYSDDRLQDVELSRIFLPLNTLLCIRVLVWSLFLLPRRFSRPKKFCERINL